MTVGFDHASHHAGDVTGHIVIKRSFGGRNGDGGDIVIEVVVDSSLLRGLALSRPILVSGNAWAWLSRSLCLASALGRYWRGGRRTSIGAGIAIVGTGRHIAVSPRSELRNSRTREVIGSVREGIDEDTGIVVLVGTRKLNEFTGTGGSGLITANLDLDAGGVELGASRLIGQMKSDNLVTEEISTTSEGGRKLERMGLPVDCKRRSAIVI